MSRKTVSILTVILLAVLAVFLFIFWNSQAKIVQAEKEAIELVSYDYSVKSVHKFYWLTTDKTYFSLDFEDQEGQRRYAIISRESGKSTYLTPEQIISEEDALAITLSDMNPHRILQARLGLLNQSPVWEVTIKNEDNTLTYYYLNAENGKWIQKIENI